jgi:hypothetical protein
MKEDALLACSAERLRMPMRFARPENAVRQL